MYSEEFMPEESSPLALVIRLCQLAFIGLLLIYLLLCAGIEGPYFRKDGKIG